MNDMAFDATAPTTLNTISTSSTEKPIATMIKNNIRV